MEGTRSFFAPFVIVGALAISMGLWSVQLLKQKNTVSAELRAAQNQSASLTEEHQKSVANLATTHQANIAELDTRFQEQIDELHAKQNQRLQAAYEQFNQMVGEGNDTLAYVNDLENRLRNGQEASEAELEKLAAIASGLTVLQTHYQKPMAEFTQLGEYFAQKASAQPDAPDTSLAFIKRIFSPTFRAQERAYREDVAKQEAFQQASSKFEQAYSRAQSQMNALGQNLQLQAKQVYDLIDKKNADAGSLAEFFESTRNAIGVHQEMLEYEPELPVPPPAELEP